MAAFQQGLDLLLGLLPNGFLDWLIVEGMPDMVYFGFAGLVVGVVAGSYCALQRAGRTEDTSRKRELRPWIALLFVITLVVLGGYIYLRSKDIVLTPLERKVAYASFTYLAGVSGAAIAYVCFKFYEIFRKPQAAGRKARRKK